MRILNYFHFQFITDQYLTAYILDFLKSFILFIQYATLLLAQLLQSLTYSTLKFMRSVAIQV